MLDGKYNCVLVDWKTGPQESLSQGKELNTRVCPQAQTEQVEHSLVTHGGEKGCLVHWALMNRYRQAVKQRKVLLCSVLGEMSEIGSQRTQVYLERQL